MQGLTFDPDACEQELTVFVSAMSSVSRLLVLGASKVVLRRRV